jgi:Xaa-Pro aminopeptidase
MFKSSTYTERRRILCQGMGGGVILLLGNPESPMNYADNTYPYRQDSSFLYYSGLAHPDLALLLDVDSGEEILFGEDYTIDLIVWMGPQPTLSARASWAGISRTMPVGSLYSQLEQIQAQGRTIHFLPPYRGATQLQLQELLGIPPGRAKQEASVRLIQSIVKQRSIKSEEEIVEIEKAVDVSVDMHLAAMRMLCPGRVESELAAEVTRIALAAGGQLSFPVIATTRGQTLHNHYHGHIAESGGLFLLDCGAETAMGYSGDLTSTFPVDRSFTPRQKEVYEILVAAYRQAVALLKPGIKNREVHGCASAVIAEGMRQLGLLRGDPAEAVAQGAHALFFPHGIGHMMGLDVHDMENLGEQHVGYAEEPRSTQFGLKSLRLAKTLEPGFVLTIEPGIYFIPELIDLWRSEGRFKDFLNYERLEKYKDFGGMRNEENYLITERTARRLGKQKPVTVAEIEAARSL